MDIPWRVNETATINCKCGVSFLTTKKYPQTLCIGCRHLKPVVPEDLRLWGNFYELPEDKPPLKSYAPFCLVEPTSFAFLS